MRILVVNDDGVFAPGIRVLAQALAKEHEITVVGPGREKSGVGHAITLWEPLIVSDYDMGPIRAYALEGTPADCVKTGMFNLMDTPPDMVVSGINKGANLGTDILYSGTVSAALEGALMGVPALAVSIASFKPEHYETAAEYARRAVKFMVENPLPPMCAWNLNLPDVPLEQVRGIQLCTLSRLNYENRYVERVDPRGRRYFWLPAAPGEMLCGREADEYAVRNGYAALTPLTANLLEREVFAKWEGKELF
jgi:5'-nucleotidase